MFFFVVAVLFNLNTWLFVYNILYFVLVFTIYYTGRGQHHHGSLSKLPWLQQGHRGIASGGVFQRWSPDPASREEGDVQGKDSVTSLNAKLNR